MTNQKLTALSALTTPTDDDILYIVDAPGTTPTSYKITWANIKAILGGLMLPAHMFMAAPADGQTYYFGSMYGQAPLTSALVASITIPKAGTILRIDVKTTMFTALATTENSSLYFRLNNTTDTTLSTTYKHDASGLAHYTGLSIAVVAGDTFEFKWVTPTWATNPQGVSIHAAVYLE